MTTSKTAPQDDDLLGPTAAGLILGMSKTHVVRLVDGGKLRAIRTPLGRLIDRDSVEVLRAERAEKAGQGR